MPFADALAAQRENKKGPDCSVGKILAKLDPADAADVRAAFASPDLQHVLIERALEAIGHKPGKGAVGRHRNGVCECKDDG